MAVIDANTAATTIKPVVASFDSYSVGLEVGYIVVMYGVGDLVGDDVIGDAVGDLLGDVVGDLVGDLDGDWLGELVGDVEGDLVGEVVGVLVGLLVGDWVGLSHTSFLHVFALFLPSNPSKPDCVTVDQ